MKFVILGAGAMGCLYGAKLKKAAQEVTFIGANQEHLDVINKNGLRVKQQDSEEIFRIPAFLAKDYHEVADAVIIFTKSTDTACALESFAKAIGPETLLISFQNGLGHERIMGQYADEDHIVIGTTNFPSDRLDYGRIAVRGEGTTRMMAVSGNISPAVAKLAEIFESAGLHPELVPDIFCAIWEKVAFNAALNSLTSVAFVPQGYLGQTKEGYELAHSIVSEVCYVAKEKGISVDEKQVHKTVDMLFTQHFEHSPSMLQDVQRQRMTEVEFINGAVVREAEKMGLCVPVTKVLYYLIRILEQTYPYRKISI